MTMSEINWKREDKLDYSVYGKEDSKLSLKLYNDINPDDIL